MSLYKKPTRPVDIAPSIQNSDLLSPYNPLDYIRLLWWILYDPHKLDAYVLVAKAPEALSTHNPRWSNAYASLFWISSILFIIEMLFFLTSYWWFSSLDPDPKWVNICWTLVLAAVIIVVRAFIASLFKLEQIYAVIQIPVYVTLYCVASTLLMEHVVHRQTSSYWIACSAFGGFCGLMFYMFCYSAESPFYDSKDKVTSIIIGIIITLLAGTWLAHKHNDAQAALGNVGGIAFFLLFMTRLDDWLIAFFAYIWATGSSDWDNSLSALSKKIPRVSPLPFPQLADLLEYQLRQEWQTGINSALNLFTHTQQNGLIESTIHRVLCKLDESEVVGRVAYLDESSDWELVQFAPPIKSVRRRMGAARKSFVSSFKSRPKRGQSISPKKYICEPKPISLHLSLDESAHAAIAGFRYLRANRPDLALVAFAKIPQSDEMVTISQTLHLLNTSQNLSDARIMLPSRPASAKRKRVWDTLEKFHTIIRLAWVFRCCGATPHSSQAKDHLAEVRRIMDTILVSIQQLPAPLNSGLAEADMLRQIATEWQTNVNSMTDMEPTPPTMKAAPIPFIHAEPLQRRGVFVGRTEPQNRLRQALRDDELPLILIYGSRQTGKTSLFYKSVTGTMYWVHVSLRQVEQNTTRTHLLDIMSDLVEDELDKVSPNYRKLSQNPYKSFALYIRTICRDILPRKLLIVLDEFEYLDDVITASAKRQDLVRYFHSLAQTEPNLHFVFVTSHTPSDIQLGYRRPFSTSLYPIEVDYLKEEYVRQLLRNPTKTFLPYCDDSAISRVMELTAGQPYLVQLIGFHLLHYYNSQFTSSMPKIDPFFTRETINAILHSQDLKRQCNHYFLNLLDEVEQVDVECIELLRRIATRSGRIMPADRPDLNRLREHDIICQKNGRWEIRIRLFAQWLRDRRGI